MLADSKEKQDGTEWCQAQIRLGWEIEYLRCQDEGHRYEHYRRQRRIYCRSELPKVRTTIFGLPGTIVTKSNQYKKNRIHESALSCDLKYGRKPRYARKGDHMKI